MKNYLYLLLVLAICSCVSKENSPEFIAQASGRYLFNANETIEIYFEQKELRVKWRAMESNTPIKINDSTFYIEALNERIIFVSQPEMHIELAPKTEHKGVLYRFEKLAPGVKTAREYLEENDLENAIKAYLAIKEKDSLDYNVRERYINSQGYRALRENKPEKAIQLFKINTKLYPKSSNTYDSLGEAYLILKDTANAIENYKKALAINPENRDARRFMNNIKKKK